MRGRARRPARRHGAPRRGRAGPGGRRSPDRAGRTGAATALIAGNAATSIEVLRHLGAEAGRLAIVGFDDFLLADILRPALTVIAQDDAAIGRTAIELLLARGADPTHPVRTVTLPVTLVPRGSGELPPA
ncbi:substrate-binding domain-containing protein [Phytohabitans flavus]|uniref:substrate-binding domain-containing protein n=1 Tax=Phytohabitans flavus TaxID=1076124 RepID=UPI00362AEE0D